MPSASGRPARASTVMFQPGRNCCRNGCIPTASESPITTRLRALVVEPLDVDGAVVELGGAVASGGAVVGSGAAFFFEDFFFLLFVLSSVGRSATPGGSTVTITRSLSTDSPESS